MSFSESEQGYKQLTFGETLSMKISSLNHHGLKEKEWQQKSYALKI